MFEVGNTYWFIVKGDIKEQYSIKGKVLEENQFMVKVQREDSTNQIITFNQIISTNKAKLGQEING
jgi:hypothetical protein